MIVGKEAVVGNESCKSHYYKVGGGVMGFWSLKSLQLIYSFGEM